MRHPDKQHWKIWYDYARVCEEAQDLASVTGHEITFRPWNGGWVIFNLRNLFDLKCERLANEADAEERHREATDSYSSHDSYSSEDYERKQLALEAEAYQEYIDDYN